MGTGLGAGSSSARWGNHAATKVASRHRAGRGTGRPGVCRTVRNVFFDCVLSLQLGLGLHRDPTMRSTQKRLRSAAKQQPACPLLSCRLKAIPNDYYRLLRVLEIVMVTGKPRAELDLDTEKPLDYDFRCFFMDRPRDELYRRIDVRCEEMLRDGMLRVRASSCNGEHAAEDAGRCLLCLMGSDAACCDINSMGVLHDWCCTAGVHGAVAAGSGARLLQRHACHWLPAGPGVAARVAGGPGLADARQHGVNLMMPSLGLSLMALTHVCCRHMVMPWIEIRKAITAPALRLMCGCMRPADEAAGRSAGGLAAVLPQADQVGTRCGAVSVAGCHQARQRHCARDPATPAGRALHRCDGSARSLSSCLHCLFSVHSVLGQLDTAMCGICLEPAFSVGMQVTAGSAACCQRSRRGRCGNTSRSRKFCATHTF